MESGDKEHSHKNNVHFVSAHSYAMYFLLLLIGITLDLVFQFKIFSSAVMVPIGAFFLIFATFLILWAENSGRNLNRDNISKEAFCRGPYCYTRAPTHWGLFFLMLGFGIIINAFFVILSTLISLVLAKFIFQDKEEEILEKKYGIHYKEYKKLVRF